MKSNIFTITLAVCLGLSSTINFCAYPQYPQPVFLTPEQLQQQFPQTSGQYGTTTPTWRGWLSPSAWWASAKSAAQSAASSTLDMANAIKRGVGLETVSYKTLGAAIAALAALNYNKETILSIVSSVYDAVAPTVTTVATGIKTVATNKYVATTVAAATAIKTADTMDKANKAREEAQKQKQGLQTRKPQ